MAIADKKVFKRALKKTPRRSPMAYDAPAVESILGPPDKNTKKVNKPSKKRGVLRKSPLEKIRDNARRTPGQRRKVAKDLSRIRLHADVPEETRKSIVEIAGKMRLSYSSLTSLFIAVGLREQRAGRLDITNYLRPSTTPRFDYEVDVEAWQSEQGGKK